MKMRIETNHHIPHVIGFIDGTHINLEKAPSKGPALSGSYHSRKERYGLLIVAVCDDLKRFRFIQWGFSAASSDQQAQRRMRPSTHPELFYDDGEVILADSGFTATANIVPMYRKMAKQQNLRGPKVRAYWNTTEFRLSSIF